MKIKSVLIIAISALLLVSLSQIFSIPPYAGDVFPAYKSGYFNELEKGFAVIKDSFIGIKSMARPEYAWVFLSDIGIAHDISIRVYDYRGYHVPAPGEKSGVPNEEILKTMNSFAPVDRSEVRGSFYKTVMPVRVSGECKFCHTRWNKREVLGAISFERRFDASVYYTSERIIIFICITIVLCGFLFAIARWRPGRNIKELFDK